MSAKDLFYPDDKKFTAADEQVFAREELIYNVTEDILIALEDLGLNKKALAERLGKSAAYVSQLLSGERNMTLGSFSDICYALGVQPVVGLSYNSVATKSSLLNKASRVNLDAKPTHKAVNSNSRRSKNE